MAAVPNMRAAILSGRSSLLTGLVSFWKLDEASGTRSDSVGTNHLADVNTVTQAAGKVGNSAQFTAANSESLSIADNTSIRAGDIDFTFSLWFYLDSKITQALLVKGTGLAASTDYWLSYDNGTDRLYFQLGAGGSMITLANDSFTGLSISTWYHVVIWHDSVANTINIQANNGAIDSLTTAGAAPVTSGQTFNLGKASTNALWANGRIDECGYWKRLLTVSERAALYNSGSGRTYPF